MKPEDKDAWVAAFSASVYCNLVGSFCHWDVAFCSLPLTCPYLSTAPYRAVCTILVPSRFRVPLSKQRLCLRLGHAMVFDELVAFSIQVPKCLSVPSLPSSRATPRLPSPFLYGPDSLQRLHKLHRTILDSLSLCINLFDRHWSLSPRRLGPQTMRQCLGQR